MTMQDCFNFCISIFMIVQCIINYGNNKEIKKMKVTIKDLEDLIKEFEDFINE